MDHDPNIFRDSSQVIQEVEDQLERILQKKFRDVDSDLLDRINREKEAARKRKDEIEREFEKEKTALTDYRVMVRDFEEQRAGLLNEARERFDKVVKFQAEIESLAKSTVEEIRRVKEIQERPRGPGGAAPGRAGPGRGLGGGSGLGGGRGRRGGRGFRDVRGRRPGDEVADLGDIDGGLFGGRVESAQVLVLGRHAADAAEARGRRLDGQELLDLLELLELLIEVDGERLGVLLHDFGDDAQAPRPGGV